jgi:hypothetical protein
MRNGSRDRSGAKDLILAAPQTQCMCGGRVWISQWRERWVQRLDALLHLVMKDKKCVSLGCPHASLRYRAPEEGRLALKDHEFGLDVVLFVGEKYLWENVSIPRLHKVLAHERRVPICERSIGNLVDDYVALCECVAGDTDRLRTRLSQQGAILLSVDGVQHDDHSPVLYVQRDVLSGEVLYAERRLARGEDDLVPMLQRTWDLAKDVGVPILGIVSDKERGLVPAIARVFLNVPHQFCQTHFLKNVAEPLEPDEQALTQTAADVVRNIREVERSIERQSRSNGEKRDGAAPAGDEAAMTAALARVGTTVGTVSGRPITDPPGLKRVELLTEVRDAVFEAAQKKRGPKEAAGP